MQNAQNLVAAFTAIIVCLIPLPAHTETFEETRAKAEQGDADSQTALGVRYNKGKGVERVSKFLPFSISESTLFILQQSRKSTS